MPFPPKAVPQLLSKARQHAVLLSLDELVRHEQPVIQAVERLDAIDAHGLDRRLVASKDVAGDGVATEDGAEEADEHS
eukprot:6196634-Pleurochrysis_carterae.AAC.1